MADEAAAVESLGETANPVLHDCIYVAAWRDEGGVREIRLDEETLTSHAGKAQWDDLARELSTKATQLKWLLEGETLKFARFETYQSPATAAVAKACDCTFVWFVLETCDNDKVRKRAPVLRDPALQQAQSAFRLSQALALVSIISLLLVIGQFFLLLQQNRQFDDALVQFKTAVQAYLWQVNTPALGASYLADSSDIELINYGHTPISIVSATLVATSHQQALLDPSKPVQLREGQSTRVSTLHPNFSGDDLAKGVRVEVRYIYLGNPYQLTWSGHISWVNEVSRIELQGDPEVRPLERLQNAHP